MILTLRGNTISSTRRMGYQKSGDGCSPIAATGFANVKGYSPFGRLVRS